MAIADVNGWDERTPNSDEVGYLMPSDGVKNALMATAIEMSIFRTLSKTVKAKQILFIIDSCYSGITGAYMNMAIADPVGPRQLDQKARQIMTAGNSGQEAKMYLSQKNSVYTYYMLKALEYENRKIHADQNDDGEVSLYDLHAYVFKAAT